MSILLLQEKLEIGSIWQCKAYPKNIAQIVSGLHSDVYFPGWYRKVNGRVVFIPHNELECKSTTRRLQITFKRLTSTDPKYANTYGSCLAHTWDFFNKKIGWSDPLLTGTRLYPNLPMIGRLQKGETVII